MTQKASGMALLKAILILNYIFRQSQNQWQKFKIFFLYKLTQINDGTKVGKKPLD